MPKIIPSCIDEVKRRASIEEVCQAWGVQLKRKGANLVGLCPFHDEKSGSFTVRPGKGFTCFGCGVKGDAVGFVMQKEGVDFIGAIERLAEKFGVLLEREAAERPAGSGELGAGSQREGEVVLAGVVALPVGVDPEVAKRAMRRQANYERQLAQERRLEMALLEAWKPKVERRRQFSMTRVVADQWQSGAANDTEVEALAKGRGWPVQWARWLADEGLLAFPALPWGHERAVALAVLGPKYTEGAAGGEVRQFGQIGYHQRFEIKGQRSWIYVPSVPGKISSEFQRAMVEAEQARRSAEEMEAALCPGLPFVMGSPVGVRLLVITEGQWDAVTFAGACGWIESEATWPEGVMVMGVRGANGVDVLLAYWGAWLEAMRPSVLILADNDAAGRKWDTPEPLDRQIPGSPLLPTFCEKLLKRPAETDAEAALHGDYVPRCRRLTVQRVAPAFGKDFNDYWKARRPSVEKMYAWLRNLGYLDASGRWV